MSGPGKTVDPRTGWQRRAQELDAQGYFSRYSPKQRAEVLRKGYLGPAAPDAAIGIAKAVVENGYYATTAKILDEFRAEFGVVGIEAVRETLLAILREIPPAACEPPRELNDPPGYPYIFECQHFGGRIYFKFQIAGTERKRRALFWSCHCPKY